MVEQAGEVPGLVDNFMADATIISRHSLLWAQENNSIIARLVNLGTWSQIRVGFIHSIRQNVLGSITPDFAFGLCAGTAAVYGDASATHFVGASAEATPWTLGGDNFLTGIILPTKKVGVTKTTTTNLTTGWISYADTVSDMKRAMTILKITKGSPNYSFDMFYRFSGAASDPTFADLTTQMETAGTPSFTSHTNSPTRTLAVDEGADGTLTAMQMYWSMTTSSIEIEGVMVSKVA